MASRGRGAGPARPLERPMSHSRPIRSRGAHPSRRHRRWRMQRRRVVGQPGTERASDRCTAPRALRRLRQAAPPVGIVLAGRLCCEPAAEGRVRGRVHQSGRHPGRPADRRGLRRRPHHDAGSGGRHLSRLAPDPVAVGGASGRRAPRRSWPRSSRSGLDRPAARQARASPAMRARTCSRRWSMAPPRRRASRARNRGIRAVRSPPGDEEGAAALALLDRLMDPGETWGAPAATDSRYVPVGYRVYVAPGAAAGRPAGQPVAGRLAAVHAAGRVRDAGRPRPRDHRASSGCGPSAPMPQR